MRTSGDPHEPKGELIRITEQEFAARREHLASALDERGLVGGVLFNRHYVLYYTGFEFIPTERPIAFVLAVSGHGGMLVPRLEVEHARANTAVSEIAHYDEYPGERHPMEALQELLGAIGLRGRFGADSNGYPWIFGYRGPGLDDFVHIADIVEDQMTIKSEAEIELLRESAKWGNLAHTLLQRYTRVGLTETEVASRASIEATRAMLDAIGPIYRPQSAWVSGLLGVSATAGYRGQIGRNASIPHALANNVVFQLGDVLVTGATAPVWGYHSELERTMVIGAPSDDQRRMFDHMVALQDIAFEAIRPGVPCSEVDLAVRRYYDEHGLWEYWRHHVGHAIGLRYHEGPFLDRGDPVEIRPGMVFTVEPGLYAASLGGFRHSDTVVVTGSGLDFLTFYSRDLESLTLPL